MCYVISLSFALCSFKAVKPLAIKATIECQSYRPFSSGSLSVTPPVANLQNIHSSFQYTSAKRRRGAVELLRIDRLCDYRSKKREKVKRKSGHCHSRSLSSTFTNCIKGRLVKTMLQRKIIYYSSFELALLGWTGAP